MQSSTTNSYLSGDMPDEHFFFKSIVDHVDDEDDDEEVIEENYFPRTVNRMKTGVEGLEINGKVRTLSPVLFYLTNTRYLIIRNNELKYLPAGRRNFDLKVMGFSYVI